MFCELSSLQKRIYNQILSSRAVRTLMSASYNGCNHLVCISALKKLCNHPLLIHANIEENTVKGATDMDDEEVGAMYTSTKLRWLDV